MPTLSQCQILNSLIKRNIIPNEDEDVDVEDVQEAPSRSIAIVGCVPSSTPQPEHGKLIFEHENARSISVNGRLETSVEDSDTDVTPFQMNRMQLAMNTMKIVPAWRPGSLWKQDFNRNLRSPLYLWDIRNRLSQAKQSSGKIMKDKPIISEEEGTRMVSPLNIALNQRHILISPVLDDISPAPKSRQRRRLLTLPRTGEKFLSGMKQKEKRNSKHLEHTKREDKEDDVQLTTDTPEDGVGMEDDEAMVEIMKQFRVPKHKRFFNVKCPDNIKDQLYLLGWRKPRKKKRRVIKKQENIPRYPRLSYMTMPKPNLDLSKDPILIKLSKKSKIMMKHTQPPGMKPKAVCFDIYGAHLTHILVWKSFERDVLSEFDEIKVESIQFVPRSLFFPRSKNSEPIENRWVITLTSEWFRSRVTGMEIHFGDFTASLRRYDDVISFEYRQYTRMTNMMKMVKLNHPGLDVITPKKVDKRMDIPVQIPVVTEVET